MQISFGKRSSSIFSLWMLDLESLKIHGSFFVSVLVFLLISSFSLHRFLLRLYSIRPSSIVQPHFHMPTCLPACLPLYSVSRTHIHAHLHTHTHAHILVQRLSFENTWRGNTPYTMSIHSLEIQFLRTNYATSAPIQGCFRDFLSNHTNLHRPHQLNWFVSWAHLRSTLLARKVSLQR